MPATAELAPVILVAAAITFLGYGTLVSSLYPPLRSIGLVSMVSAVSLAAASVLLLPALLLVPNTTMTISAVAVIAAFDEAATIADVVNGIGRSVAHVIVVNDGSTDATAGSRARGRR